MLALLLALPGCNKGLIDGQNTFRRGDVAGAHAVFESYARGEGQQPRNRVIALLELGATQQALGDFEASNHSLAQAQAAIDQFDEDPELSLSTEARALLINLNELPYRGWDSDRIMAATLRALNFLALGDPSAARVSLNRAYRHQQEAVARNAEALEDARAAVQRAGEQNGVPPAQIKRQQAVEDDPRFNEQFTRRYAYLDQYAAYADYVNPFTELLAGLYFLYHPADRGDAERARKSLERAAGLAPDNPHVARDLDAGHRALAGGGLPPTVHLFFATGTSPRLDAFYLELPLFIVSSKVNYFAASFPTLAENKLFLEGATVSGGGASAQTRRLADLDAVVGREFKNRLPHIVLKSILSAAAKSAAAYALNESLRNQTDDPFVLLSGQLATIGYQAATNQADQRIWASLPKHIDYARLPVPANGVVRLGTGSAQEATQEAVPTQELTLDPTRSHGVWVRSVSPSGPLMIFTFPLGPSRTAPTGAPRP